ncbi:iron (metal) dependent repressor, dtxr family protein [Rufibacter radiotolerans]|uniref:Transcriptional regulator MntR n=1 Tax=Rufibacter radiotolerans TaxID=1379910 RepID=A0A0H4W5Q8_9BACT|nr:metal-dependent transcriptional regulator [Rufibacter radiotolerans]AKQ45751.1 iron (metal) dependent repressor, dtxr family protein [Rufibacter radiotolerans]
MVTHTEENYLKALFTLANEASEVNISDLGILLEVSTPTVNSMVKKLHAKDLVVYEKYRPLVLTAKGRKEAALIIRKHRLTEMYLVEKMGFGWEEVHEIAEQVEHITSWAFFDKMDDLMGHPTVDPHGSPIPDKNGQVDRKPLLKLSTCQAGEQVRLEALANSSTEFLKYLNSKQLSLGVNLEIVSVEAFDGSMVVKYLGHTAQSLSQTVCEKLQVQKL